MTEKHEIVIDKKRTKSVLKTFFKNFAIAFILLFLISLIGSFEVDSNNNVVYLETVLSDIPYLGIQKTYEYGQYPETAFYTRNVNFELSEPIENVLFYKLTNFYLPYIFFRNILLLLGLTGAIILFR